MKASRPPSRFRMYADDGIVHLLWYVHQNHGVWPWCRRYNPGVAIPYNKVVWTEDPTDCLDCLAEGT